MLQVPTSLALRLKCLVPFRPESGRNGPPMRRTTEAGADEMALLPSVLTVHKALTTMENREIIDEMDVSRLGLNVHFRGPGDCLNGIECLHLTGRQRGQPLRAWVSSVAHERSPTEIHDKLGVFVEDDRTALKMGTVH